MILVQNRTSRALRLAGKLIYRWDKVTYDQVTPAQIEELAAAEKNHEVWCTPSQVVVPEPPRSSLPQQRVVLKPPKNHKR